MRFLFSVFHGLGHFHPMVPYAQELSARGHEVAFATSPLGAPAIKAAGFECIEVGGRPPLLRTVMPEINLQALPHEEREALMLRHSFAGAHLSKRVEDLLAFADEWRPDLVIRDSVEYTGAIAAERLDLPHAVVQVTARTPAFSAPLVEPLNALRAQVGLPVDPQLAMEFRYLHLDPFPPSFRRPDVPPEPTTNDVRPVPFDTSGTESRPDWIEALDRNVPTVYATLGTVFNSQPGVFETILEALRDQRINLVLTIGRNRDPEQFGPQPPNVHVERYVPQTLVLPKCNLVLTHGGSGTVLAALSFGLPLVTVPLGSDQWVNAERVVSLELGKSVPRRELTPDMLRRACLAVLENDHYHDRAQAIREEIERLPDLSHGVDLLVELAQQRVPLVAQTR